MHQLSQTRTEETVPLVTAKPREVPAVSGPDAPRYDAQMVQQILSLAQQMQTRHRETMTPGEIEALGREVGVEPPFVRRALAQIESQAASHAPQTERAARQKASPGYSPLTGRQCAASVLPAILFALLTPLTYGVIKSSDVGAFWLYLVFPLLWIGGWGFTNRSRRVGALSGGLLAMASVVSLTVNENTNAYANPTRLTEFCTVLVLCIVFAMSLGFTGAALRQEWDKNRAKRSSRRPLAPGD